jgi:uncharacterized metal-binding protein YceD (DUF177 family)
MSWSVIMRLSDVGRGPEVRRLEPDDAQRDQIATTLGLQALPAFSGEARVEPWHDGAEIHGRWTATVTYACGLTLEPFDAEIEGDFTVRAVPPSSPLATEEEQEEGELDLDPEADDPPDVLAAETLDLAAYLVEDLSLSLDPFPRKPGAVFAAPPPEEPESPFAVLKRLKEQ